MATDPEKGAMCIESKESLKQPIEVAFRDVRYVVKAPPVDAPPKKGPPCCAPSLVDKMILNGMSGVVTPGQFLAIIGASGSGKTTLLNCLANHYTPTSGTVLANGQPLSENDRHAMAYIAQEDHLMPTSTVFDTLNLSAQLRLPRSWSTDRKTARVEELLRLFRLEKHRDTLVGSADEMIRGISGGERKRLSIAVELISYPSVIFLDEPTSGLDSKIAADVCEILKDIALGGCTVLASIHQPSSEVFAQFDQLMILSQGNTVYFGSASTSTEYFASISPELECPTKYNPADYFMQLTYQGVDATDGRQVSAWTTEKLVSEFQSRKGAEIKAKLEHHAAQGQQGVLPRNKQDRPTFCTAIRMLNSRSLKNLLRNKMLFAARIGQTVFLGLIIIGVYGQMDNSQESIQSRQGVLFFLTVNQMMLSTMNIVMTFPEERAAFVRENRAGMYSALSYYLSKVLVELPFQIMFPTAMAGIIVKPINLDGRFVFYALFMTLLNNVGQALGMLIGCTFKSKEVAMQVMPLAILPIMIFGGLFVNLETIPVVFHWLQYASPIKLLPKRMTSIRYASVDWDRYSYNAMLLEEFSSLDQLSCSDIQKKPDGSCPFDNGQQVIATMGMDQTKEECFMILLAMYFGLRVLAYMMLLRVTKGHKGTG